MSKPLCFVAASLGATLLGAGPLLAQQSSPQEASHVPGLGPALTVRTTQSDITSGSLSLKEIRRRGMVLFSTPFNRFDGYGDGPLNVLDPTSPGGRPTLQDNGTFLRVNGLDSQTCMECHSVGSNAVVPFRFAIGGVGGSNNNAMFMTRNIDVDDSDGNGFAFFDGRYINPPFLFGAGGVELVGKEMTRDLQIQKQIAQSTPGLIVQLVSKGVSFGSIVYDAATQTFDTSNVQGVDADLVVRPFGRKGDNSSIRQFDIGALQFHLGMQPEEVVGSGVDGDGDGVVDEILTGELSAMHVFGVMNPRPVRGGGNPQQIRRGRDAFMTIGCADCHVPTMNTNTTRVPVAFPEVETDPTANVFLSIDLTGKPAGFRPNSQGGIQVPMFSDLKRHDMGPALAESFGHPLDSEFITARLWGIADTAPYLHDGRALTISDAIGMHGGEGQFAADNFAALPQRTQVDLLAFLDTLKTPIDPNVELLK